MMLRRSLIMVNPIDIVSGVNHGIFDGGHLKAILAFLAWKHIAVPR
jgi:hypothetical protein